MLVENTDNDEDLTRYSSVVPARYAIEFKDFDITDAVTNIKVDNYVKIR